MKRKIKLNEDGYGLYYLMAEYETEKRAGQAFNEYDPGMRFCPHLVRADLLKGQKSILYLYVLPLAQRWWIEAPVENPSLAGAIKATLYEVERPLEGEVSVTWGSYESPPCGSDCLNCSFMRDKRCEGCPIVPAFRTD